MDFYKEITISPDPVGFQGFKLSDIEFSSTNKESYLVSIKQAEGLVVISGSNIAGTGTVTFTHKPTGVSTKLTVIVK